MEESKENSTQSQIKKAYVLDTNIILNDVNNLYKISQNGENEIILPETVIDELDTKKTGFEEINFQAREFARMLSNAEILGKETFPGDIKKTSIITIVKVKYQHITISIVSSSNYNLKNVDPKILNDRKIISIAEIMKKHYSTDPNKEVILLTIDSMCKIRAISLDVKTETLSHDKKEFSLNFIKTIELDDLSVHGKNILDIDKNHTKDNFCYIFKRDEKQLLGVVKDNKIITINEAEIQKADIKPRNTGQFFALQGMLDPHYNMVLIEALAGSGKTLLAIAAAMRNIDMKRYEKLIYIRNSIESLDKGEEVGFLSGNEEKFKIYNYPLYDTLDFMASLKQKKKENAEELEKRIEKMIEKYKIETMWVGSIRGRTISKAFVIIDEIQNFSKKSLQTVLSRLDSNCKVVCIGSNAQIDNPFINKYTNGLNVLLKQTTEENPEVSIFATKLDKVERGALTAWAERIFKS